MQVYIFLKPERLYSAIPQNLQKLYSFLIKRGPVWADRTRSQSQQLPVSLKFMDAPHSKLSHICFAWDKPGYKVYSCQSFISKTPTERAKLVKANKRFSCLVAHMISACTWKMPRQTLLLSAFWAKSYSTPTSLSVDATVSSPLSAHSTHSTS